VINRKRKGSKTLGMGATQLSRAPPAAARNFRDGNGSGFRTIRDDCGDVIIRSKRGHLYVDDGSILGLM
jgi:hypothetical protein